MKQNRERYQFFSRYVHILYCLNTVCLGASRAPRKLRFLLLNVHYLTGYLPFFPFSSSKNSSSFIIIIIPLFLSSSMLRPFSFLFPFSFFFFFYLPKRLILYYYSCILSSFIFGITFTRYILCKERNNVNSNNVLHPFLFYPSAFVLTFKRRIIHHDFLDYYFFYYETKSLRFSRLNYTSKIFVLILCSYFAYRIIHELIDSLSSQFRIASPATIHNRSRLINEPPPPPPPPSPCLEPTRSPFKPKDLADRSLRYRIEMVG